MADNALSCSVTFFLGADDLGKYKQHMRRLAEVKTLSPVVVVRDASHRSRLMIRVLHIPPEQGRNTIADELENFFLSTQISAQTKQKMENSMTVADRSGSF